mgnify:CR=1 FL=1
MNADEFIRAVDESRENRWIDSSIHISGEKFMETLSDHFKKCTRCHDAFDTMKYPQETLLDLWWDVISVVYVEGWVCHNVRRSKCYTYQKNDKRGEKEALREAKKQGRAIEWSKYTQKAKK